MKENLQDDTILARWLNGELSADERADLEKHPDFSAWQRIAATSAQFQVPDFDKEASWKQLQRKRKPITTPSQAKIRPLWRSLSIAASIALLLGASFLFLTNAASASLQTAYQEQQSIDLPDGSKVSLNADSEIEYTQTWLGARKVRLKGEAFFEVEKGKTFSVESNLGTVTVLGTSFNVRDRENYFEVECFSGKVRVEAENTVLLGANERAFLDKNELKKAAALPNNTPTWTSGRSTFDGAALSFVFAQLERQYGIEIIGNYTGNRNYKGFFPHNDLPSALQNICDPMNLKFEILNEKQIRITEN